MGTVMANPLLPKPLIYARMAAALKAVAPVGLDGENREQHYKFRAIEDVMTAVHAALASAEVFYVPTVIERLTETRTTSSNRSMNVVHLMVQFTFYATDGSNVSACTWGEGTDMADKATNKAMTQALKYALIQTFCLAERDMNDPDSTTTEAASGPSVVEEYLLRIAFLADAEEGRKLWKEIAAKAKDGELSGAAAGRLQDALTARQSAILPQDGVGER
jgi:ERF superfamily